MAQVKIRFIKAHPAGIHEGKVVSIHPKDAAMFINDGWAVEEGEQPAKTPQPQQETSEKPAKTSKKKK